MSKVYNQRQKRNLQYAKWRYVAQGYIKARCRKTPNKMYLFHINSINKYSLASNTKELELESSKWEQRFPREK